MSKQKSFKPPRERKHKTGVEEQISMANRAHELTSQDQLMDTAPNHEERKIGEYNRQGQPPLMKK